MSYPLQQTHSVLQKCLQSNDTCRDSNSLFAPVWEEIHNFQSSFLQSAASVSSEEAIKVLLAVTITGCTNVLNMAFLLRQRSEENQSGLSRLESSLNDVLSWLRTSFACYTTEEMALPRNLAKEIIIGVRHTLSGISGNTGMLSCTGWLKIISDLVTELFEKENSSPSYRQASYIGNLLAGMQEASASVSSGTGTLDEWAKMFIRYNCNEASVVDSINRKLLSEAGDAISLTDRIEKWQAFRQEIIRVTELDTALHPGIHSVKTSLLSVIDGELSWLGKKELTLSSIYGGRTSALGFSPSAPLLTTLSVSQLAVWCRLLSGCNILKHDNQTELLKLIAGALQTTRAANISADSLRVKYYSPDRAALAVVKEQLFRMMSLVKDM